MRRWAAHPASVTSSAVCPGVHRRGMHRCTHPRRVQRRHGWNGSGEFARDRAARPGRGPNKASRFCAACSQRGAGLSDTEGEAELLEHDVLGILGAPRPALAAVGVREFRSAQGEELFKVVILTPVGRVRGQDLPPDPAHRSRLSREAG